MRKLKTLGMAFLCMVAVIGVMVGASHAQDTGCDAGGNRCTIEHPDGSVDIWYGKSNRGGAELE